MTGGWLGLYPLEERGISQKIMLQLQKHMRLKSELLSEDWFPKHWKKSFSC